MKRIQKFAFAAAAVLLTAACCPCRSYQKKMRRPLAGTEWQLIQLGGRSMHPEQGTFCLTFDETTHTLTGRGACNSLTANYRTEVKQVLRIGPLASTMMACPDADTERAFAAAIEATTHYDMDGPTLLLLSDGELQAVFQALPEPEVILE